MTFDAPFLRADSDNVARQGGRTISRTTFLTEVAALAAQLPDRPYVVNFCDDRYRFTVAWAAAMLRGQITLLPTSRDAAAVAALRVGYPSLYTLTDDALSESAFDDLPSPRFAYPDVLSSATAGGMPAFPPDQVAAVLFTSGSTGRPTPSPRRWGRLVAGAIAAGAALGVQRFRGAALIATVPHAHSYGLESAVMLPLQHGLLLTANRPFFPADVAAALQTGDRPGILVTTPIHLRALVGDAATAEPGFGTPVRAGFVLSATAPLSDELAARAEATFSAPVFEIYGCSEAGQLATRRTVSGPPWRCLSGFHMRQDAAGTWVSGPEETEVLLADEIELTNEGAFILRGRTADMVNVAGKRSSLAYLTRQLTAIEGVKDGIFLMPEETAAGVLPRLVAVVVAPGLDAATILAALRGRIDPAFLPRPLHVVDTLPRNALGKLPRSEVLRLIEQAPEQHQPDSNGPGDKAPQQNAEKLAQQNKATERADISGQPESALARARDSASANPVLLHFAADHPAGPGHFPGNPIIPGAVLLDNLVGALFPDGWSGEVEAAKFHHPVRPGDTVAVTHRMARGSIRFECRLTGTSQLVLTGALRATSPSR